MEIFKLEFTNSYMQIYEPNKKIVQKIQKHNNGLTKMKVKTK
jgi:hypothetical protein